VATTNRNMAEEIRAGHFREDLYYRLNVFPLNTAALAARPDDIVPVATFLLNRHVKTASDLPWLADDAVEALRRYGWPGNVRELENVLQRALVLAQGGVVSANEILIDDVMHQLSDELPNSMAAAFRQTAAQA
jgi:two-component system response regulator FlrC